MQALRPASRPSAVALLMFMAVAPAQAEDKTAVAPAVSAEQIESFEKEIRPLLAEHCHKCHGERQQKGHLRLDSRAALLAGGDTGPAIVPGKPGESLLIDAVSYGELYQMPPTGKLADNQIAALRRWIEQGAAWPAESRTTKNTSAASTFDLAERAKHWCFQPLGEHALPPVKDPTWPRSSTDVWILSRLDAAGLSPAGPADKATLLRRATFDLIGLPPASDEIADFLADERPDAFKRAVNRLLASPHFGERWGRHWLDLVRYAESKGHEFDYTIPNAWQYRDYIIRALNADLPYDEFVVEHVAGDLVERPRRHPRHGFNESLLGTGFWFLGEEVHSPVELKADELDRTDNKIDVFSKTFLALTVACARCHDHKFDAITTKDYYALAGHIVSASYRQAPFDAFETEADIARRLATWRNEHQARLLAAMHAALRPVLDRMAEILLATREVIQAAGVEDVPTAAAARGQAVASVAAQRGLSPSELTRWVEAVRQAAADNTSPLYPWAMVAAAQGRANLAPAALLAAAIERSRRQPPSPNANVVIDYGQLASGEWRQDGFAFGCGPVQPGDISFGVTSERSVVRVWDRAAAVSDPFWGASTLAAGVEREAGRLSWSQSGRMLRTPTFTLTRGKLFYLVSGSGYAYAAVHSHRMNNGPLHATLVREWQARDGFQWIEHDLSAYRGQRVHVEFSPRQPGETKADASPILAIDQVVEGDRPPPDVMSPLVALALSEDDLVTPESLAAAYQRGCTTAAERLAQASGTRQRAGNAPRASHLKIIAQADTVLPARSREPLAWAALANWLSGRMDLFVPADGDAQRALATIAASFVTAQAELVAALPRQVHTAPTMLDGNGVDECVMLRGNFKTPGEIVPRRYLEALGGTAQPAVSEQPRVSGQPLVSGSGRLALARQMTSSSRPLLARVIVNRIWQHLFGRGIVASVDNFGVLGERPTHPELLDQLAREFIDDGWSLKRLIRRLMLTRTYQSSSRPSEAAWQVDPLNLLLSHAAVKRLEAEAIRDNILAVSGRLDRRMFGRSVPVYLSEFMEGRGRPPAGPLDGDGRRSIYLSVRRNFLSTFFLAFDYPVPFTSVGRRSVSNVPAQALTLMNSPFVAGEARRWAENVIRQSPQTAARVDLLYRTAFGRLASEAERHQAAEFIDLQSKRRGGSEAELHAWADLCHVLLNGKEFVFLE